MMTSACLTILLTIAAVLGSEGTADGDNGTETFVLNYLQNFNFLPEYSLETGQTFSSAEISDAVRDLQRNYSLPVTGIVNERTRDLMSQPRCGNIHPYNRVLNKLQMNHSVIKWAITEYPPFSDINFTPVQLTLKDTFNAWKQIIGVNVPGLNISFSFTHTSNDCKDCDLVFRFYSDVDHKRRPFQNMSVLPEYGRYYLNYNGTRAEIHLTEKLHWLYATENINEPGRYLHNAVMHMLGHVFGLDHPITNDTTMFPILLKTPTVAVIGEEEEEKLKEIVDPIQADSKTTGECEYDINAVLEFGLRELLFFIGKNYWKVNKDGILLQQNKSVHETLYGLNSSMSRIDAAFNFGLDRNKQPLRYIFVGKKYYSIEVNIASAEGWRDIVDFGFPFHLERVDAAFVSPVNNKTYIFAGDLYWRLSLQERPLYFRHLPRVEPGYPKPLSFWRGVTLPVTGAFVFNGSVYIVSGSQYWKFNEHDWKTEDNYPRSIGKDFFGCVPTTSPPQQQTTITTTNYTNQASHITLSYLLTMLYFISTILT